MSENLDNKQTNLDNKQTSACDDEIEVASAISIQFQFQESLFSKKGKKKRTQS